jgi:uncharacterized protein
VRIDHLVISEAVLEKLAIKHGVTFEEVEEVCLYTPPRDQVWRKGRGGTMRVFARTYGGRYLFVVLVENTPGVWRVVTARDMNSVERRLYEQR